MNDYSVLCDTASQVFNRQNFESNAKFSSSETFRQLSADLHIWEIPFLKDAFNEDNDTSDEENSGSDDDEEVSI
jgi:hypothetical protein